MRYIPNWKFTVKVTAVNSERITISSDNQLLTFREVFTLWKNDPDFVERYRQEILQAGGGAFFWEHPPLREIDLDQAYEVKLVKTNSFDSRTVDEQTFREHFRPDKQVVIFPNLGGDAPLIAPVNHKEKETYKHFGAFLRKADTDQVLELFKSISETCLQELAKGKQIWLNTEGTGVIWLHVRLDARPKYYKTAKYRDSQYFLS
ncbi:MAG: hypothetical protein AAF388_16350 [Bacteroidota bacterium]